jgi:hypothetical protein
VAMNFLKKDNLRLGLVLGLLFPLLGMIFYYYWKIYPNAWSTFFRYLVIEKRLLSSLTVVCLLFNVAIFTIYVNTRRDQTAKGIFASTLIYAIISLVIKFLA